MPSIYHWCSIGSFFFEKGVQLVLIEVQLDLCSSFHLFIFLFGSLFTRCMVLALATQDSNKYYKIQASWKNQRIHTWRGHAKKLQGRLNDFAEEPYKSQNVKTS
jgi:hypothetical protein